MKLTKPGELRSFTAYPRCSVDLRWVEALTVEMRTERLLLRQFRADDIGAYAAMCADPEVMRYLSATGEPLSREDAWRQMAMFCGHWGLRGYGMWVAEELRSGDFIFAALG